MRIEAREREHLTPYLSPDCIHPSTSDTRRADKTGLIACKANKYSVPMARQVRYNLFHLINSLYEYRSIILTTNKDFTNWGEFFHDDNVAVPIIDRVIHHLHIFMLGGETYRLKQKTIN